MEDASSWRCPIPFVFCCLLNSSIDERLRLPGLQRLWLFGLVVYLIGKPSHDLLVYCIALRADRARFQVR